MKPVLQLLRERLLSVFLGLLLILTAGTAGYVYLEGWPAFDALYMTVITLSTVGYGETHELSRAGRAFSMLLIFSGVGVLTYTVSNMTAFFVEGTLTDAIRRSRMLSSIQDIKDHYIVCGAGHSGNVIINELKQTGRPFVVIEDDEATARELLDRGVLALRGDATEDETLKKAGIERAKGLFTTLATDRDNAFVALTARGLAPGLRIVSEQVERGMEDKLRRSGADEVVRPSRIGGLRMASVMVRPAVVGFLDSMMRRGDFRIEELVVPAGSALEGTPLGRIRGGEGGTALVLAVRRPESGEYLFNPPEDRPVKPGEILVVMGSQEQQKALAEKLEA